MERIVRSFVSAVYPILTYGILLVFTSLLGAQVAGEQDAQYGLVYTGAAALAALFLFHRKLRPQYRQTEYAKPITAGNYAYLCCASAGFCLVFNLLIGWAGFTSDSYRQAEAVLFAPDIRLQVLLIGLLVPAAEELIFRGMSFRSLREETGFWAAAVLSSLLFGLFHGNIVQGVYAFFGGLLMAWSYERFGSLKVAWCVHASSNLLSLFISSGSIKNLVSGNIFIQICLLLTGIVLLLSGVIRIGRTTRS